jgi:circadian clock protein KaiC
LSGTSQPPPADSETAPRKKRTGVSGLDDVLHGGLTAGNVFLLEGEPGTGKTTLALSFLREGARLGERCLYITLSETEHELRAGAASHGWAIDDNIAVCELAPPESLLGAEQQSLLYAADLELGESTRRIFEVFEQTRPDRVVIDSLSEIRLLAQESLRYRRQILAFKHYFARNPATVLLLDDLTSDPDDKTVHSVVHAVIQLEEVTPFYGAQRRRLRITKYRGQSFRGGYHDFTIRTGGLAVFPRLVSSEHRTPFARTKMTSDIPELNSLLGGGIEQGSSVLVIGPSGTGKTTFTHQFVAAGIKRGEKAMMFVFDEELGLLFDRTRAMGIDLEAMRNSGALHVEQVDAAELSPGEFAYRVREQLEAGDARTVIIDSLNGYQASMPDEKALLLHIHELLQYLNRRGATTFLTVAQHGLVGQMDSPVDVTYLADTVVLLRYFEARGKVRRAVSCIKKRTGYHEETIREFQITGNGLRLGAPLHEFQGILRGTPTLLEPGSPRS